MKVLSNLEGEDALSSTEDAPGRLRGPDPCSRGYGVVPPTSYSQFPRPATAPTLRCDRPHKLLISAKHHKTTTRLTFYKATSISYINQYSSSPAPRPHSQTQTTSALRSTPDSSRLQPWPFARTASRRRGKRPQLYRKTTPHGLQLTMVSESSGARIIHSVFMRSHSATPKVSSISRLGSAVFQERTRLSGREVFSR